MSKGLVRKIVEYVVLAHSKFVLSYYKIKNSRKPRLFIYTDSRGYEISSILTRKSYRKSFIHGLIKDYNCDVFICPEKHTTFIDFFEVLNDSSVKDYDSIICLVGVVDFSPRRMSEISAIQEVKFAKIEQLLEVNYKANWLENHREEYLGEKTSSLLGFEGLRDIAKMLLSYRNVIWVSCNPVDLSWRGNYFRDRPKNINIVNELSKEMIKILAGNDCVSIVDNTTWNLEEVRKYTCDNIHYSKEGMRLIENKLKYIIDANLKKIG